MNTIDPRADADEPVTTTFGPVEGVMQSANGDSLAFRLTLAVSGPKVPQPPPKFKLELPGSEPGQVMRVELHCMWPD